MGSPCTVSHAIGFQEELLQSPVRVGDGGGVVRQRLDGGGQGERELSHGPVEFCDRLGDVCRGELGIQVGEPRLRGIGVKIGQAYGGGKAAAAAAACCWSVGGG